MTVDELVRAATRRLAGAGVPSPGVDAELLLAGFLPAEEVPCLYVKPTPAGDCAVITLVDDLLFSEGKAGN